jgi:thioredoxin reductase
VRCMSDVAIVGAGPYGLSIAAHLQASNVSFRIFGAPMQTWREHMPAGMLLKSDGFASNLSDPASAFRLEHYCRARNIPYDDTQMPVALETFTAYGLAFQERLVPELEQTDVTALQRFGDGFRLHLATGETMRATSVVLAVGISHFQYVPPSLMRLPAERRSHSSAHRDPARFRGQNVTVVGAGASAVDLAVLLHEAGAHVTLLARRESLTFFDPPAASRSLWARIRYPNSPIGQGWKSRLYCDAAGLFYRLPEATRYRVADSYLGPASSFPMKTRFVGNVPAVLGCTIEGFQNGRGPLRLMLSGRHGSMEHATDHVIAATGYAIDLRRLTFLSSDILEQIHHVHSAPVLSPYFESSVPGLYFVGPSSKYCFGPMMRFACGAGWTARRITRRLVRHTSRRRVVSVRADQAMITEGNVRQRSQAVVRAAAAAQPDRARHRDLR